MFPDKDGNTERETFIRSFKVQSAMFQEEIAQILIYLPNISITEVWNMSCVNRNELVKVYNKKIEAENKARKA